ncbi:hypothetical protein [Aneurinibacillus danicus]|uniref:Uncharacterized protein n=1 Tax=Aneurinibacillus danicus TaxID=267746 RepID=A0A511V6Y3_9BACL|nr:hypothetical protein [Aneurinibacillus danicus]GEN34725.1 hypothetical protein ADA01nite_21850 [Aneurinibacillus danicus]
MNIVFTELTCRSCGVKLTEYEAEEKDALCMECYNEKNAEVLAGMN